MQSGGRAGGGLGSVVGAKDKRDFKSGMAMRRTSAQDYHAQD